MISSRRGLARVIAGVAILALATIGGALVFFSRPFQERCCAREWRRYDQPGGNHAIVVYRIRELFAMPGQSSDAPGIVRLVNGRNEVERTTRVDMVQDVSEPEWSAGHVHIKLIADWPVSDR